MPFLLSNLKINTKLASVLFIIKGLIQQVSCYPLAKKSSLVLG